MFTIINQITSREKDYKVELDSVGKRFLENLNLNSLQNICSELGGSILNNGSFKIHNFGSAFHWKKIIETSFPNYVNMSFPFASDWMGRQFAVSVDNSIIYMFDPATMDVFELTQSINGFFEIDLVEYKEETLSFSLFKSFNESLKFTESLGFKKPLFIGGKEEANNYAKIDTEFYWDFNHQIYLQTKDLPEGTIIKDISFE